MYNLGLANPVNYYQCCKCQAEHFEDESLYRQHIGFQSKHGIFQMTRERFISMRLRQVEDATEKAATER